MSGFQQRRHQHEKKDKSKRREERPSSSHVILHSTQSQSKLDMYYTGELLDTVKRLYAKDYKIWNLIKDEEELVSVSGNRNELDV